MSNSKSNESKEIERSRIEAIFKKLDTDQDGRIGIKDLTAVLDSFNLPSSTGHAEKFLDKYDSNKDGVISIDEFVNYITEHEKALKLSFESLDHNKDGFIDAEEIIKTFKQMGIHLNKDEAMRMIKRMDKDDSLTINWNEWRDHLIMFPTYEIKDIYTHWRHSVSMDMGEPAAVPDDYTEAELKSGAWWRHLLAGGMAGAVSRSCTAPFDRLKLTLMVYASQKNQITIVGGVREMIKEGGFWSLWRGNGINVVKIAPETAVKFMAYEQIKRLMMRNSHRELGIMERFTAGSMAGAVSQTVIYPIEVLKTRLSLRKTGQYKGVYDCAKVVYKSEGVKCFFKGYLTNLLGIIPYAGIDLAIYETLKQMYITKHGLSQEPGTMVLLGCGIFSSCSGAVASYPLALIRTKQQMNAHSNLNLFGYFKYILKHDGPRGLYRGIAPNFLKVAPAMSISYVVYEHSRKVLGVGMT